MHYDMKQSGEQIRRLRKKNGYTQEALAKKLNIDRSLISHIEAGKRGCTVDMLVQLSELFNVSLDLLILGRETVTSLDDEVKAHLRSVISGLISYLEMLMKKI